MKKLGRGLVAAMLTLALLTGGGVADTTVSGPITFSTGLTVGSDGKVSASLSTATVQTWPATQKLGDQTPAISGSTFTPDMSAGQYIIINLVHASCPCTIANPTNMPSSGHPTGVIVVKQSSSGSDAVSWGSYWQGPGGTVPSTSTTANAVDEFGWSVDDSTDVSINTFGLNFHH